jgi:translation initiation factor IF-3
LSRPYSSRYSPPPGPAYKVNGKIRAREVRVIGVDGKQMGVLTLGDALTLARANGVDLVEIAPNAAPPVCRLVDYGKFRYEQSKKDRESRKHQHATKVKEIQLSPKIDPHDLGVKLGHAIDFLCEDMRVKITLKFRGREMAHTEFGFQVIDKFLKDVAPYGHPDFAPKQVGRGVHVMVSPLPRNKRAKNPRLLEGEGVKAAPPVLTPAVATRPSQPVNNTPPRKAVPPPSPRTTAQPSSGFANNPFAQLEIK